MPVGNRTTVFVDHPDLLLLALTPLFLLVMARVAVGGEAAITAIFTAIIGLR